MLCTRDDNQRYDGVCMTYDYMCVPMCILLNIL